MTALFSSAKGEWFTPKPIIERVHNVMGGIDLDPASCAKANEIVGAKQFFTASDDALNRPWHGRVFVNPPGTCPKKSHPEHGYSYFSVCDKYKVCSCDLPRKFWNKLMQEFQLGNVPCAVYLGFSLNQLSTLQGAPPWEDGTTIPSPLDFSLCILKQRLKFLDSETLEPVPGPTQHNFVSYIGGSRNTEMLFRARFEGLGVCK